jgi:hypothetical protein
MWTQIVGKTRLALSPLQAHWWNVPLYVSARGLSTSAMPYGSEFLEVAFDFVGHELKFLMSTGASLSTPLRAQSVAEFYLEYQRSLAALGVSVEIYAVPVEVQQPVRLLRPASGPPILAGVDACGQSLSTVFLSLRGQG